MQLVAQQQGTYLDLTRAESCKKLICSCIFKELLSASLFDGSTVRSCIRSSQLGSMSRPTKLDPASVSRILNSQNNRREPVLGVRKYFADLPTKRKHRLIVAGLVNKNCVSPPLPA